MYGRLFRYLRPHTALMVVTVASRFVAAALDAFSFTLLIPFLNLLAQSLGGTSGLPTTGSLLGNDAVGAALDATIGGFMEGRTWDQQLTVVIVFMLSTVAVKNVFVWWGGVAGARLQELVSRDMRDHVYSHVLRLPMSWHRQMKLGQILSRLLSDTRETKQVVTQLITQALQNFATILASLAVLVALSPRLTLYALVIAPLVIVAIQPLLRRLRKGYRRSLGEHGEMNSLAQEVLSGVKLVKAAGAEEFEQRRFAESNREYARGLIKVTKYSFLTQPVTETIGTLAAVGILWIGATEVRSGVLGHAALITFLILTLRLLQPLKQLSQLPAVAQGSFAAAERLFEVLDHKTERASDNGSREITGVTEGVQFRGVNFHYSDGASGEAAAVVDVSLDARQGEIIAIVGPSGAGKTTLVDLIPRFNEPVSGSIRIDGVDTREIKLESLRKLVGVVSQETVIFNDTVRNNIAYAVNGKVAADAVESAARLANAHEFIAALPQGYETVLGDRGARLSGGQRQRIAIARALLANQPVLILDEATLALDTESERLVQEAIERLLRGRTVFVIAHRLSTVMNANQILVLNAGRVVERGTHAELLQLGGLYARLHALQFRDPGASAAE